MEAGMSLLASLNWRRVLMIVGTLLVAFGSGHVMQNLAVRNIPVANTGVAPDAAPVIRGANGPPELPVPPAATLTPILETPPNLRGRVNKDHPLPLLPRDEARLTLQGAPCRASLEAKAKPAGMIGLTISAPCWPSSTVQIHHGGLNVTDTLDAQGRLVIDVPALSAIARVEVTYPDNTFGHATLNLPEVEALYRVALLWDGPQILTLHALELGAIYGERGHIYDAHPGSPDRTLRGDGGFLTRLGDGTGSVAEVYTYPREDARSRGVVRLSAEAEVTSATCGQIAEARAIQTDALGGLQSSEVLLAMPDCEALGEIVLLKNLFKDLRLAGR
jgi:hypothetical protein